MSDGYDYAAALMRGGPVTGGLRAPATSIRPRDRSLVKDMEHDWAYGQVDRTDPCRMLVRFITCLLYTSPSPRDRTRSRMPSSA